MPLAILVGLGSALGALARVGLGHLIPGAPGMLLINAIGSLVMGRFHPGPLLGRGVLGGFTSFSTFVALTQGLAAGRPLSGALYAAATVACCVGAWVVGDARFRAVVLRGEAAS